MKVERVKANLDFQAIYQVLGLLFENIDNAKKAEYESILTADNSGLPVFNTDTLKVEVWTGTAFIQLGGGGGAVDSVNSQTGVVVLDADDISDASTTNKFTTASDISKLAGIEANAEVNNISDVNAANLTDGSDTTLHTHDSRYYTETETDTLLLGKANSSHTHTSTDITDFNEAVEDIIGVKVIAGTDISVTYNDTTGETTINNTAGSSINLDGGTAYSIYTINQNIDGGNA